MTTDITQRGIDILAECMPDAEVTGEYQEDVNAWTWTVLVDNKIPEGTESSEGDVPLRTGASRQFVSTSETPEPSDDYLRLVAVEIRSILASP